MHMHMCDYDVHVHVHVHVMLYMWHVWLCVMSICTLCGSRSVWKILEEGGLWDAVAGYVVSGGPSRISRI